MLRGLRPGGLTLGLRLSDLLLLSLLGVLSMSVLLSHLASHCLAPLNGVLDLVPLPDTIFIYLLG